MSKKLELLNDLEVAVKRQDQLMAIRSGEAKGIAKRELNDDETAEFDLLEDEIVKLKSSIEREAKFEKSQARNAAQHFVDVSKKENKDEKQIKEQFSMIRAIRSQVNNVPLSGVELEVHQEAQREARSRGESVQGFGLPSFMMDISKRDLTVGTAATAGNLVATDLGQVVPALSPRMKVIEMGAQVLDNLNGNLDLPIGNALASATWEGENDAAAETTPSTSLLSLRPNRLAAYTNVSKQLLGQSSTRVENWVRAELSGAVARAVDVAAINGSGASNQPEGILNKTGIGDVALGTNGAVPTYANIVTLETEIANDNADVMNMGYLTTPGIRGILKSTAQTSNNAGYIWTNDSMLNGYQAHVSTQVPSDLVKGSSSDCHGIIFGNFADLVIANWGLVDIIVDPYTLAKTGLVQIVVNSYWDVGIKHAQSFAAIKDATLA